MLRKYNNFLAMKHWKRILLFPICDREFYSVSNHHHHIRYFSSSKHISRTNMNNNSRNENQQPSLTNSSHNTILQNINSNNNSTQIISTPKKKIYSITPDFTRQIERAAHVGDVTSLCDILKLQSSKPNEVYIKMIRILNEQKLWDSILSLISFVIQEDMLDKELWMFTIDILVSSSPMLRDASVVIQLMAKSNFKPADIHIQQLLKRLQEASLLTEGLNLIEKLILYRFPPSQENFRIVLDMCLESKNVELSVQLLQVMIDILGNSSPMDNVEKVLQLCMEQQNYTLAWQLHIKCRQLGIVHFERGIQICLELNQLDLAIEHLLDSFHVGRAPNKIMIENILKMLQEKGKIAELHYIIHNYISNDKFERDGIINAIGFYNKLGLHFEAIEMYLWAVHCGFGGYHNESSHIYIKLLDYQTIDSNALPIFLATLINQFNKQPYVKTLANVKCYLPGAIEYTHKLLQLKDLPSWQPDNTGKYDISTISYTCVRSTWFYLLTELLVQSIHGEGHSYIETKLYLRRLFSESTVNYTVWFAQVIAETKQNLPKAKETYLNYMRQHSKEVLRWNAVTPWNIGMWMAATLQDYSFMLEIYQNIPSTIEHNSYTYSLLITAFSKAKYANTKKGSNIPKTLPNISTENLSQNSFLIDIAYKIGQEIIAGKSIAGSMNNIPEGISIEDRFMANIKYKELLCVASKDSIRNLKETNPILHHELYIDYFHKMFILMKTCLICGYPIDDKQLEVCILILVNSNHSIISNIIAFDYAVQISNFFLYDRRPNHYQSIKLLLTKLTTNQTTYPLLVQFWKEHSMQLYSRYLEEYHVLPICQALLQDTTNQDQGYTHIIDLIRMITTPKNSLSEKVISNASVWTCFLTACNHFLVQKYAPISSAATASNFVTIATDINSELTDKDHMQIFAKEQLLLAIENLYTCRKIFDLTCVASIVHDLHSLNLHDYAAILLIKLAESYMEFNNKRSHTNSNNSNVREIEGVTELLEAMNVMIRARDEKRDLFSIEYNSKFTEARRKIQQTLQVKIPPK